MFLCNLPVIGQIPLFLLLFSSFFFTLSSACSGGGNCQVLESCSAANDCAPGLYCGNCPAANKRQPVCTRGQANIPTSINGVRGLMLDMYDFEGDIWLCHSFQGRCYNITAFGPAIDTLREVEAFLTENPSEIVTIIIEDYVQSPKGLTQLFANAGLEKYWYPVTEMPKKGEDWPTVNDMVQKNHRLLVFTSDASKEEAEGIAYQWRYMVENEPGDPGVKQGSCPNRRESKKLNSKGASLFLMNYFPTYPVEDVACKENSAPLANMIGTCDKAAGNRMPNFVAVNFYMRSDGPGVFDILDKMNGQSLCGCTTITACQQGSPPGVCKNVPAPILAPPTSTFGGSFSGSVQLSGFAPAASYPNIILICFSQGTMQGINDKILGRQVAVEWLKKAEDNCRVNGRYKHD
uniref:Uncharacterized protein n=1 Tax=Chenopodium quinoa TaxID=63459 RepID=A0A803KXZ0_CHEQI